MPPIFRRVLGCALSLLMVLTGVAVAFPQTPLDVTIEIYYDAGWQDITGYVYHRDAAPITITRGRANEGRACDPGRVNLQLNNRDGRFSPRNPNSPLFGKIGRNTPIRVSVTESAVTHVRFVGEIPSWPSRWDVSGKDIWVPVEAAGILRRLGQGSKPLRSPLFRTMLGGLANDIPAVAYWPMEDGALATRWASPVSGISDMTVVTPVELFSSSEVVGSFPLPVFGVGAGGRGPIPTHTDTGFWAAQATAVAVDFSQALTVFGVDVAGGTAATVFVSYNITDLALVVRDSANVTIGSLQTDALSIDPTDVALSIVLAFKDNASGSDDFVYARAMTGDGTVVASIDYNIGPGVYGSGSGEAIYPNGKATLHNGAAIGHVAYYTDPAFTLGADDVANALAINGHDGETADERFQRICEQTETPFAIIGTSSARVGPERAVTKLQALRDAEATDQGFMFETRDSLGLQLRTNSSRYNQTPLALDYGEGHISAPFDPEPDDKNVANDREVKRRNGSSARRELPSGPLSVQDPPDGVGRYDDSITVDAYTDDQLEHIANWRLHVGTWDAERYPRVRVDLSAPGNNTLIPAITAADSGDLITIANLPAWLPPETAELIIEGYREVIGFYTWDFVFNCSPGGPYNVVGVWALLGQELHAAATDVATTIDIATTSGPLLATAAAQIGSGYGITIGGEELQVTAVAASTVTYGAVGVVAHANNASVTPALPASVAAGNLLVIFAAIRNSGTGVVVAPTGYTRLAVFPAASNVQVFAKVAGGSESAPTVTITGGAANADVSAQIIRLAGKWHSVANVLLAAAQCLNVSAQNITYPGLPLPAADNAIVLYLGWKQDDWTSVVSPGTEIAEEDTTTGDDQGIVWAYGIQTTAAAVASGTFAVTGGAAGVSRGAVLALRCDYQTATVTRSVNGIIAAHSAADAVTATRPMRWGL